MLPAAGLAEAVRFLIRTSARRYVPQLMMTTAGPAVLHSLVDCDTAETRIRDLRQ